MDYRPLGRTGLNVSALCLGTMTWGDQNSEAEGHEQMDYALDHGINFFDTAEMYSVPPKAETQGSTERIIGTWFKSRGKRDKVILASKVIGRSPFTWFRDDGSPGEQNRKQILEAVDKSLKRLQTDYIDLYQLHWPDRPMGQFGSNGVIFRKAEGAENPLESILDALADCVKAGKIRHVGLSNESAWGTMAFLRLAEMRGLPRMQSIQNAYSLLNRTFEIGLAEIALREHVGLLAYSPLAQGVLTGKYLDGALPAGTRKQLYNRLQRYETPGAEPAVRRYVQIAREFGLDIAQMGLAFVTSRSFVTSNIIGASSMAQLKSNIASLNVEISPELEQRLDAVHLEHTNPCP